MTPPSGITLLDGATGTELSRRGFDTRLPLWSALPLADHPEAVTEVHRDWVRAGAGVISTCTFRTHARSLAKGGLAGRSDELNRAAVSCARSAIEAEPEREGRSVRVAGSISPLEDCFRPDRVPDDDSLAREHAAQASSLAGAGCDLLLVETMGTSREALAAVRAAVGAGLPAWCAFPLLDGRLLSGEAVEDVAPALEDAGASALLVNCVPARGAAREVARLAAVTRLPVGCYPNIGHADDVKGWRSDFMLSPDQFGRDLLACRDAGATLLGGCCGTEPRHLEAAAALLS